jgi:hypothetical protein
VSARPWQAAIGIVIATLVGAVVAIIRSGGTDVLDSMWAEDGSIFLQQAFQPDPAASLFHPYRGYLHVLSRLIAGAASLVPIEVAAAVMAGGAALVVGAIAVFVYVASTEVIASRVLRGMVAGSVVLTPVARIESLGNVANLHFFLVFAAFWALIWVPRGRLGVIACCVVIVLAALGNPLVALLLPVAVVRWRSAGDWTARAPVVVGAVALAVQVITVVLWRVGRESGAVTNADAAAIAALYPIRVVGGALLGMQGTSALWDSLGGWLIVTGAIVLAAVVTYAVARRTFRDRWLVVLCLGLSAAFFAVSLWVRWDPDLAPAADGQFLHLAYRYLLVPVLFVLAAIAILLDRPDPRVPPGAWTAGTLVVVALVVATWVVDLTGANARTDAPSWAATVAASRARCVADGAATVGLPIAPDGWSMTLPCAVLLR